MSFTTIYPLDIAIPVNVPRESYENVGANTFTLGSIPRMFLGTGFSLWDSKSGGTELTLNSDYTLELSNAYYSAKVGGGEVVYAGVNITNVAYQTGAVFATYDTIGSPTSAEFYNVMQESSSEVFRNAIVNGSLGEWQRGTNFSAVGYLADQIYLAARGNTDTITQGSFNPGVAASVDIPNNPKYYLRTTFGTSGGLSIYELRIENPAQFSGQTWSFGTYARSTVSSYTALIVDYFFDLAAGNIDGGNQTFEIDGDFELKSFKFTFPDLTGETIAADDFLSIRFLMQPNSTGNFDFTQSWMNQGDVLLPPPSISPEENLRKCQWFYRPMSGVTGSFKAGAQLSTPTDDIPMRTTPTPVVVNGTGAILHAGAGLYNVVSVAVGAGYYDMTTSGTPGANIPGILVKGSIYNDASF